MLFLPLDDCWLTLMCCVTILLSSCQPLTCLFVSVGLFCSFVWFLVTFVAGYFC